MLSDLLRCGVGSRCCCVAGRCTLHSRTRPCRLTGPGSHATACGHTCACLVASSYMLRDPNTILPLRLYYFYYFGFCGAFSLLTGDTPLPGARWCAVTRPLRACVACALWLWPVRCRWRALRDGRCPGGGSFLLVRSGGPRRRTLVDGRIMSNAYMYPFSIQKK